MAGETSTITLGVDSSGVRNATSDLQRFAQVGDKAEQSTKEIEKALTAATLKAELAGKAIGAAISGIVRFGVDGVVAVDRLIKSVGDYQDLADKTGADPAGLASLQQAADVAGVSLETVASSTVLLSARLAKVGDDSKGAGRALAAIGIEVENFKSLRPDEQYKAIAVALDGYADGAGKVAVATELFGRGGAEQLKVFKELASQTQQSNALTDEQIALADDYADSSKRLQSQLGRLAEVAALQSAPAIMALKQSFNEAIAESLGLSKSSADLANDDGIKRFAEGAVQSLGFVVDAADGVYRSVQIVGGGIGGIAAAAVAAASGNFKQAFSIISDIATQTDAVLQRETFGAKLARNLANQPSASTPGAAKPPINTSGFINQAKGRADKSESAQLAADLDGIKKALADQTNAYKNAESILDAIHSAGLIKDSEYYAAKRQFIERDADAQVTALDAENTRLAAQKASGAERIRINKQIADNIAKIAIVEADASAKVTISNINQKASQDALTRAYQESEVAANAYLQSLRLQAQRNVAAVGQGDQERSRSTGLNAIEDRFTQKRDQLESDRRRGAFKDNEEGYQNEIALLQRTKDAEIGIYNKSFSDILAAQGDFINGATRALQNYADKAADTAGQVDGALSKAFTGAEDALVKFVTTGKLSFTDLANGIVADLARIAIKQSITAPLAKAFLGSGGSGGGFLDAAFSFFGAGKADGGSVASGGLYPINERGPELLSIGSRDYLSVGSQGGTVTPMSGSGGQSISVANYFTVGPNTDRRSQDQIAAAAGAGVQRALARNN